MYCTKCGNKLNNNDNFCTKCGNKNENIDTNVVKEGNSNNFSFVFGVIAVVMFFIPFISIPLAIVSIVLSKKNEDCNNNGVILGIISIVLSVIFVIVVAVLVFLFVFSFEHIDYNDDGHLDSYYEKDYYEEDFDDVIGNIFSGDNDTVLYLNDDMSYVWYMDNTKSSFYSGTYKVYNGYDAVKYISDSLGEYGIDMEEQMDIFNNNRDKLEDYYLIIFNRTGYFGNNNSSVVNEFILYYGIYYDDWDYLDLTNMKTNDKVKLTLIDDSKGNNSL